MLMSTIAAPAPTATLAASAIHAGSRPASCTTWTSMPDPSARRRDSSFAVASSREATISDTTSPAPRRAAIRRNTTSVTPDIGASRTALRAVTGPTRSGVGTWLLTAMLIY